MNKRYRLRGGLLFEVMVACALIAIIVPLIGRAIWQLQTHDVLARMFSQQETFSSALASQFSAQWSRLRPAGCSPNDHSQLRIGKGGEVPKRLQSRDVDDHSDWLQATDSGACRLSIRSLSNPLTLTNECGFSPGERANVSTCLGNIDARVSRVSAQSTTFQLSSLTVMSTDSNKAVSLVGQTGVLESRASFYWYVGRGKNHQPAFWRTPVFSGRSLALWLGLKRLAVFPLLDDNQDGKVDAIDKDYGTYDMSKVLGLWVEYLYQLNDCEVAKSTQRQRTYHSMRGEQWQYNAPCEGVANTIVVFTG